MSLEIFTRDIVLIIGLGSLIAVCWQLNRTNRWNKINFTYNILNSGRMGKLENEVIEKFELHQINIVKLKELNSIHLNLVKQHQDLNNSICEYLNFLEHFCIAVNKGAVEEDVGYEAMSSFVIESWHRYKVYIAWHREDGEDIYSSLEKYAKSGKSAQMHHNNQTQEMRCAHSLFKALCVQSNRC